MPLTKDAEARLRAHLATIGMGNWHESDRDVEHLLNALESVRTALTRRYNDHQKGDQKTGADCTALAVIKSVRNALEGEA